jgi:hypothetical protein
MIFSLLHLPKPRSLVIASLPAPGRMVDIGGYAHLNCRGPARDNHGDSRSGLGDFSVSGPGELGVSNFARYAPMTGQGRVVNKAASPYVPTDCI